MNEFLKRHPHSTTFLASAAVGCILFVALYGVRVLDGTNIDWILAIGDDFTQSYLGWCFYRASDWQWPIGLMENVAYPSLTPILYIDSVPLFDLLFKLLSPLLPATFQFFGIWGLACFALSGGIGGCIISRLTGNVPGAILSSPFFVLCTFAIQRLYMHTSLAANWVILLVILAVVVFEGGSAPHSSGAHAKPSARTSVAARLLCWFACFFLAVSVNIYYVPIIGIMLLAYVLYDAISHRRLVQPALWLLAALAGALAAFYLFGGFYHLGSTSVAPEGLGLYSANFNSLVNPMEYGGYLNGFSTLLPSFPLATVGQYEGFAYLGAGLILCCILACVSVAACGRERRRAIFKGSAGKVVAIAATVFVLACASTGGFVAVGDVVIAQVDLPWPVSSLAAVFRSSGRFMWGVWDIVAVVAITLVLKACSRKLGAMFILVAMLVQCIDLAGVARDRLEQFANPPMASEESWNGWVIGWKTLDALMEGKRHLVYVDDDPLNVLAYYDTAFAALRHNASISDFYYSRKDEAAISEYKATVRSELEQGNAQDDTLYLFSDYDMAARSLAALHLYLVDGYVVGSVSPIDGFDEVASIKHRDQREIAGSSTVKLEAGDGSAAADDGAAAGEAAAGGASAAGGAAAAGDGASAAGETSAPGDTLFALVAHTGGSGEIGISSATGKKTTLLASDRVVGQFRALLDAREMPCIIEDTMDAEVSGLLDLYAITMRGDRL